MSFLSPVIQTGTWPGFMEGTWTVTRRAPSTNDGHGRAVAGSPSTFTIDGSLQPAGGGRKVELAAAAAEGREVRTLIADATLNPATPTQAADVVSVDGEDWEVVAAEHWSDDEDDFTTAIVARVAVP